MRTPWAIATFILAALAAAGPAAAAAPQPAAAAAPAVPTAGPLPMCLRPELASLADALTWYVSFDADSLKPDLAEGPAYQPQFLPAGNKPLAGSSGPRFVPGLSGRALVLGCGRALYPLPGNILLAHRGALAFWIQPRGWQRPNDGNVTFAIAGNGSFYLQRQGPLVDRDRRALRNETTQYLVRDQGNHLVGTSDYLPWENGRWYLVVANWSWPAFELSINGQAFMGQSLARVPPAGSFDNLLVGDAGGGDRGLLDELMAFRRPLTLDEVRMLHASGEGSAVGGQ